MLVYLRDKLSRHGKTTFSRRELNTLLDLYASRVQKGEWRDYAIDSLPNMAVFSVFKSSRDLPVYSIMKIAGRGGARYEILAGNKTLKKGATLLEVLEVFEE